MRAGRLDRLVEIQEAVKSIGRYGDHVETYQKKVKVWAEVTELRGSEFWQAKQVASEATTQFEIRFRDDITTEHRVKYNNQIYDIEHVVEMEYLDRRRALQLLCAGRGRAVHGNAALATDSLSMSDDVSVSLS